MENNQSPDGVSADAIPPYAVDTGGFMSAFTRITEAHVAMNGYIPIYTVEDLNKISNGVSSLGSNGITYGWSSSAYYVLMNDIDFGDTDLNGGYDVQMEITKVYNGLSLTVKYHNGTSFVNVPGTINVTYNDNSITGTNPLLLTDYVPSITTAIAVKGSVSGKSPETFVLYHTLPQNITGSIQITKNSNGNFDPLSKINGTFNGNGYKIKRMQIASDEYRVGIFLEATGADVRNLGMENLEVSSYCKNTSAYNTYIGGLVAQATTTQITNCYVEGDVRSVGGFGGITNKTISTGGIVGETNSNVSDSYMKGNVACVSRNTADGNTGGVVGKIVGANVINCQHKGDVMAFRDGYQGTVYMGGIAGHSSGTISDCYNSGGIIVSSGIGSPPGTVYMGGISGYGNQILNSHNSATVDCIRAPGHVYMGGISAVVSTTTNCYNEGNINTNSIEGFSCKSGLIGGIVGSGSQTSNCYNTGNVSSLNFTSGSTSGNSVMVAGIAGSSSTSNCYSVGSVRSTGSQYASGIIGYGSQGISAKVNSCYFLSGKQFVGSSNTPLTTDSVVGPYTSVDYGLSLATGDVRATGAKSVAQLKDISTYYGSGTNNVGWDFTVSPVWGISSVKNGGYPYLANLSSFDIILSQGDGYTLTPQGTSSSPVKFGGSYSFTLAIDPAYSNSSYSVKVNGTTIYPSSGVYTISNISSDKTVTVTGVVKNTYMINTSATNGTITASTRVTHGGSLEIQYGPKEGYHLTSVTVNGNPVSVDAYPSSYTFTNMTQAQTINVVYAVNTYTVEFYDFHDNLMGSHSGVVYGTSIPTLFSGTDPEPNIAGHVFTGWSVNMIPSSASHDSTVEVRPVSSATYEVTPPGDQIGYTLSPYAGSSTPVLEGGSFTFVFSLDDAYSDSPYVIAVNGDEIQLTDGKYTITNIMSPQTISVTGIAMNQYIVSLSTGLGYTLSADTGSVSPVLYGGSFTFVFTLDPAYSDSGYKVKVDGSEVTLADGKYVISDIRSAKAVTVEDIVRNSYIVTLQSGTGYTLSAETGSSSPVLYGGTFTFVFSLFDAYSDSAYTIEVNGSEAITTNGKYTIDNIMEPKSVTVMGVEMNTYIVTLQSGTGYALTTYSGSSPTVYGGSYTFSFSLDPSYSDSDYSISVNGVKVNLVNGRHVISDIRSDQTVTVTGVEMNRYNVVLSSGTGYSLSADAGSSSPVFYDGTFTFVFTLEQGYSDSDYIIKVNDSQINLNDGKYTVTGITSDISVIVSGVQINTYAVSLPYVQIGYMLTPYGGSGSSVTYGGSYSFSFSLDPAYSDSQYEICMNGTPIHLTDGRYTISGITEAKSITVAGVEMNTYEISLPLQQNGYTLSAHDDSSSPVTYGGSYVIAFSLDQSHSNSDYIIKMNGSEIILDNGTYTISNITEDKVVTVEGVLINTYMVILPEGEGYTFSSDSDTQAEHGTSFTFRFNLDTNYSNSSFLIKINGMPIELENWEHTISSVECDSEITISGIAINRHSVIFQEKTGYIFQGPQTAEQGKDYVFTIQIDRSYSKSPYTIGVTGGSSMIVDNGDGNYTVKNVQDSITITTTSLTLNTYQIIVSTDDNAVIEINGVQKTSGTYTAGTQITLNATMREGYVFNGWFINGNLVEKSEQYTFVLNGDVTIQSKQSEPTNDDMNVVYIILALAVIAIIAAVSLYLYRRNK